MGTATEPAQVNNATRQVFRLRRAHAERLLTLAVTLVLFSSPLCAQNHREAILRLRDDVSAAMAHVSIEERQTQKLDHCRQTLLMATQSGPARATRRDLDQALRDIEKIFHSSSFLQDDRDAVRQDISQIRAIERNPPAHSNARRLP